MGAVPHRTRPNVLPITRAQADLLSRMGFVPHALKNDDELRPKWWLEGGGAVKANVAQSLWRLGFVRLTGHWGGMPGMDGFTVTAAGREALREYEGRTVFSALPGRGDQP